jgi:hypothetical protein
MRLQNQAKYLSWLDDHVIKNSNGIAMRHRKAEIVRVNRPLKKRSKTSSF